MKMSRIPYSLPMARSRREGHKTMTRRVVNPQPIRNDKGVLMWSYGKWRHGGIEGKDVPDDLLNLCPYGKRGDILLPVEPWRAPRELDALPPRDMPAGTQIWLDANGQAPDGFGRYRHARFMPKHLIQARDLLVQVRVERLQDISEADAIAEGIEKTANGFWSLYGQANVDGTYSPRASYRALWESINGFGSWDANPFVWVIKFRRVEG